MSSSPENSQVKRASGQPLAESLRALGLGNLAAGLLEGLGPLNALFAQFLYLGQPLLSPWMREERLAALAQALEDDPAALAAELRQPSEGQP